MSLTGGALARQLVLDRAVDARQFLEERIIVIGEAVGDLVEHFQLGLAQHIGAPERQDGAAQPLLALLSSCALSCMRWRSSMIAAISSSRVSVLLRRTSVGCAVSTGLTRAPSKKARKVFGVDPRFARAPQRMGHRAGARRRPRHHMGAIAPDMMLVLGDIGEMREIAIGAHDRQSLVGGETVEDRLQFAPGADLIVAVESDRGLADALDDFEHRGAFLLAHRIAENAAEQANVVAKGEVLIVVSSPGASPEIGASCARSASGVIDIGGKPLERLAPKTG